MLLEIGIGDSFGAGYEFSEVIPRTLEFVQNPRYMLLQAGMYTDDCQMALANAEVMLDHEEPSMMDFANAYVGCYKRDRRDGYARGFQAFLDRANSGIDFIKFIQPFSDRSGAAMRSAVLGLYPDVKKVMNVARLQAVLTHNSDMGIHSALAVALAAHYLYYELGRVGDLGAYVAKNTLIPANKNYYGLHLKPPGVNGSECAHLAIEAVMSRKSLGDVLLYAVQYGGDTDTVAAIAGGLCAASRAHTHDIPQNLLDGFEDGSYGKTYLRIMDERLAAKFPRPK